jgi:hypothetical protein
MVMLTDQQLDKVALPLKALQPMYINGHKIDCLWPSVPTSLAGLRSLRGWICRHGTAVIKVDGLRYFVRLT